jgi:hypothetical protein
MSVIEFPNAGAPRRPVLRQVRAQDGRDRQRLLFRSRELILQSGESDLVRDVSLDIDRARGKLERMRARADGLREYAATELRLLTEADIKLSAAIVAALLSTQRQK